MSFDRARTLKLIKQTQQPQTFLRAIGYDVDFGFKIFSVKFIAQLNIARISSHYNET